MQRRKLLLTLTAVGTVGLAGCSGGNSEGGENNTNSSSGGNSEGGDSNADSSSGECPSLPLSYTGAGIDQPPITFDIPTDARTVRSEGDNVEALNVEVNQVKTNWNMRVIPSTLETPVDELEADSGPIGEELTSQYDTQVEDARVFPFVTPGGSNVANTVFVYFSTEDGTVRVQVAPGPLDPSNVACPDAAREVFTRVIETVQPAE